MLSADMPCMYRNQLESRHHNGTSLGLDSPLKTNYPGFAPWKLPYYLIVDISRFGEYSHSIYEQVRERSGDDWLNIKAVLRRIPKQHDARLTDLELEA